MRKVWSILLVNLEQVQQVCKGVEQAFTEIALMEKMFSLKWATRRNYTWMGVALLKGCGDKLFILTKEINYLIVINEIPI